MTDRPKRPRDANQLAKLIVDLATGQASEAERLARAEAAVARGKKGGVALQARDAFGFLKHEPTDALALCPRMNGYVVEEQMIGS